MTTIAVDKTMMAGDTRVSHPSGATFNLGSKLTIYDNPLIYPKKFVVGYAGELEVALILLDYFIKPEEWKLPKKWQAAEFLVLTEQGKIFNFSDPRRWYPIKDKHYAIGSGATFAMGAMETGKTPAEALKIAIKLDKNSGGRITKVSF
jgi:ATP-dependent protease HslVU (ClpYQ) peptidase subunit